MTRSPIGWSPARASIQTLEAPVILLSKPPPEEVEASPSRDFFNDQRCPAP